MAWNGSNDTEGSKAKPSTKTKARKPSPLRGVIAGMLVVAFAIGSYLYFFTENKVQQKSGELKEQKRAVTIKEVRPAPAPRPVEVQQTSSPRPAKVEKPIWERPIPEGLGEDSREAWKRRMAYEKKLATDERLKRYLKNFKPKPSIYKTGTEQVLDWIFYTKVGDHPPPPLPQVSQFELNHIDEILDSVNEINDDDDKSMVERKQIVDEVKKELKKYLEDGGSVQDFLEHYRNELVAAHEMKSMVASEIDKEINESENSEKSIKFIEKANRVLEDRGIPAVELTEDQKEILAEGFEKK